MRILLLSQYFAPEPLDKVVDLACALQRAGHSVHVITGFPCYPQGKIYPGYRQKLFQEEVWNGIQITRLPQFPDHSRSTLRRSLYYVSFAISAATIGLFRARRADVVWLYQSALPLGFAGWVLSRAKRIPLVLDVVDLWPESVEATRMLTNRFAMSILRQMARLVYSRAARIIVITDGYRRKLIELGVPSRKIDVIHCWPADGLFDPVPQDSEFASGIGLAGKFNVVYAGSIGPCQHLDTVIDSAFLLRDLPQVQFVLLGSGIQYEELKARALREDMDNVRFLGFRAPSDIAKIFALSELLLVHLRHTPMSEVSIPSKTFAYMASGRPLLMAVEGEAAELVCRHQCGITVEPSNAAVMASAIRSFVAMPKEERDNMGIAARQAYRECYCSAVQVAKVAGVMEDAVTANAARGFPRLKSKGRHRDVVVFGSGGHGKVVISTLIASGYTVTDVYDDAVNHEGVLGIRVQLISSLRPDAENRPAVMAIGDSASRRHAVNRLSFRWISVKHPTAWVDSTSTIGDGSVICAGVIIQSATRVGKHVIVNTAASVDHDCEVGDYVHIGPGARLAGRVKVGEGCFLGTGCIVIPGVTIGAGTTIGAGAVVVRDVGPGVVAVGCPARVTRAVQSTRRAA